MTHLQKIQQLNQAFDVPMLEHAALPADTRWRHRYNLLVEELEEYKAACEANDQVEALDALVDLQVVLLGTVLEMGFQSVFNAAFDMVQKSNLSKICPDEITAQATVEAYTALGVNTYYKKVLDHYVVYRASDHKFLKNINWTKPDYTTLL